MKNNSKTLTIETKKLWIIGIILSFIAAIYPSLYLMEFVIKVFERDTGTIINESIFSLALRLLFPYIFGIFLLFVGVFILLCKWQSKKSK